MKHAHLSICTLLIGFFVASGHAYALEPDGNYQVERMNPGTGAADYIDLISPMVVNNLDFNAGGYISYAKSPLSAKNPKVKSDIWLDSQTTLSLVGSLGLFDFMEIGFMLPITLYQSEGKKNKNPSLKSTFKSFGINDPRLSLKFQIFNTLQDDFGLGVIVNGYFPLGNKNTYLSDKGLGAEALILGEYNIFHNIRVAGNIGFRFRQTRSQFDTFYMQHEIPFAIGGSVPLWFSSFDFILEIDGAVNLGKSQINQSAIARDSWQVPVEGRFAARWGILKHLTLTAGVGTALNNDAVGVPDFRAFLGLDGRWVLTDKYARNIDYDADNLVGDDDQCPEAPEDYDGFEDDDGCPDWDNDEDGVADTDDQCPDTPKNTPVDASGCPIIDNDRDGDGIPNDRDKCPLEPEDKDGFQDSDGCPDPDNDGDNILDVHDKCPNKAETYNGFEDDDGCPDDPNARVKIGKDSLIILEQVFFETGKAKIRTVSFSILDEVAKVLEENPQILRLEVQGHTDSVGNDRSNMKLSDDRAAAVRQYLIDKGIAPSRLTSHGYGETKPIADNKTKEGRAKNRRVEFKMLEIESRD